MNDQKYTPNAHLLQQVIDNLAALNVSALMEGDFEKLTKAALCALSKYPTTPYINTHRDELLL